MAWPAVDDRVPPARRMDLVAPPAAIGHHTGWETGTFRGSADELPAGVRAVHLLEQMFSQERRRLLELWPAPVTP